MARPRSEKVQQLKRHLLSRIEEGYLRPGDRFLSNRALSTQFGISYQTAHRLIAELEQRIADGDAAVHIPGCPSPVSATSTVVGGALLQALVAATVAELQGRGHPAPVWQSANGEQGEASNAAHIAAYRGRIKRL